MDGRSVLRAEGATASPLGIALKRTVACSLALLVGMPAALAAAPRAPRSAAARPPAGKVARGADAPPAVPSLVSGSGGPELPTDPTANGYQAPVYLRADRPLFRNFTPHFKVLERSGNVDGKWVWDADPQSSDAASVALLNLPDNADVRIWEAGNLLDDRTFGARIRPVDQRLADRIEGSFALHDAGEKIAVGGFVGFIAGATAAVSGYIYLKTVENGDPTNSVGKVVALDGAILALSAEAVSLGGLALDYLGQPKGHVFTPREAARTVRSYNEVSTSLPGNHPHLTLKF